MLEQPNTIAQGIPYSSLTLHRSLTTTSKAVTSQRQWSSNTTTTGGNSRRCCQRPLPLPLQGHVGGACELEGPRLQDLTSMHATVPLHHARSARKGKRAGCSPIQRCIGSHPEASTVSSRSTDSAGTKSEWQAHPTAPDSVVGQCSIPSPCAHVSVLFVFVFPCAC